MELSDLRIYCDLVETGSFSRAAERNFISQSAVSQRLRVMENEFSSTFLERKKGKGRAITTEAGKILYEMGKRIAQDAMDLETALRGFTEEVAGPVRVATVYSVGLHALPSKLKPFLTAHPNVNIHLEYSSTDRIYEDVLSGSVDLGVVAVPTLRAGIEITPFSLEPMTLICAPEHPFASLTCIPLEQLDGCPFLTFDLNIPTRRLIDEKLKRTGTRPRIVMTFDNIEMIKNLVEIGSGVALVPAETALREVKDGSLVSVPLSEKDAFTRPVGLLTRHSKVKRMAVRALVEALTSENIID